jgi:hypothetical protein
VRQLTPEQLNQLCQAIAAQGYKPTMAYLEQILQASQISYRPKDLHYWVELWRVQQSLPWHQLQAPVGLAIDQFRL